MHQRPLAITVVSWIFIASGVVGFLYHVTEFNALYPIEYETVWICLLRLLAVLGGVLMLRGIDWGRWLSIVWIAYHVILSAFHSRFELIAHSLLFVVFAYLLFRKQASVYFRSDTVEPA